MNAGKTIQIFLPDGNPRGIRIAEITSRTIQAVSVPRSVLIEASKRDELSNVGVYFLIGEDPERSKQLVYIGEAEDCLKRLKQHNQVKDFWTLAIAVVSKTKHFSKSHIKFLEWLCLKEVSAAGRYAAENANSGSRPHISEAVEADLHDNFESIQTLVSALGHPLFDRLSGGAQDKRVVCKGKKAAAQGEYTEDGLVVFSGSTCNIEETAAAGPTVHNARRRLLDQSVIEVDGDAYRFQTNQLFPTPSAAAIVVLGRRANGWTEWKYADGRTLDDVHRQSDGNE